VLPLLNHLQHRIQDADHRTEGPVLALVEATQAVKVAEQLVGPINEMDDHGERSTPPLPNQINRQTPWRNRIAPSYFHSHIFVSVLPAASTSNSKTPATALRRDSCDEVVSKVRHPL